ncbi:MAG: hypothetical protein P4L56_12820 [Candidatus Sulfopaludibacter sp.]|nr:hypothetical protein [Candidatus Sulfopaludibacter sp.]
MRDTIAAGSVFIDESARLPNTLLLQREPHSCGWAEVTNVRSTFGKEIPDAGWTYFFMAGEIKTTVFGFDRQKALSTALSRLIANAKGQNCNSIEITQVTGSSFLKVPYVGVSAHPRHLQKGLTFSGPRQSQL